MIRSHIGQIFPQPYVHVMDILEIHDIRSMDAPG